MTRGDGRIKGTESGNGRILSTLGKCCDATRSGRGCEHHGGWMETSGKQNCKENLAVLFLCAAHSHAFNEREQPTMKVCFDHINGHPGYQLEKR
jgi:hypothetical protein